MLTKGGDECGEMGLLILDILELKVGLTIRLPLRFGAWSIALGHFRHFHEPACPFGQWTSEDLPHPASLVVRTRVHGHLFIYFIWIKTNGWGKEHSEYPTLLWPLEKFT